MNIHGSKKEEAVPDMGAVSSLFMGMTPGEKISAWVFVFRDCPGAVMNSASATVQNMV